MTAKPMEPAKIKLEGIVVALPRVIDRNGELAIEFQIFHEPPPSAAAEGACSGRVRVLVLGKTTVDVPDGGRRRELRRDDRVLVKAWAVFQGDDDSAVLEAPFELVVSDGYGDVALFDPRARGESS
jgi:hypothetical protein